MLLSAFKPWNGDGGEGLYKINWKAVRLRFPTVRCAVEKRPCQPHKSHPAVQHRLRTPKPAELQATAEKLLRCLPHDSPFFSQIVDAGLNSQ